MAKDNKKKLSEEYGAKQITVLEGLEPVRKRPGMYIGSTGPEGLHHLVWEVADNSFDEAMGGHANDIQVRLLPGNRVEVRDNGRGIPTDMHPQYKVSALELVMTKLHAGGKFGEGGYKVSGGLHGVGVSVVNALSIYTKAEVHRDGKIWVQEYKRGKPVAKVKQLGNTRDRGTIITFEPDSEIFQTIEFSLQTILDHFRQQAYLTKGVKLTVRDDRKPTEKFTYVFFFEGGVASYVKHLNHAKHPKHENVFYVAKTAEKVEIEVALQYTEEYKEAVFAFANNIYNPEGGSHVVGFRTALTRVLNTYARNKSYLKEKDENLSGDDVREGLTAVISVKVKDPQFEGQTKSKLGNPEVRTAMETVFGDAFATFLEEHPRDGQQILEKCVLAAQARAAARAARDTVLRKGVLEGLTLPGKLADCSSRDPKLSELFLVEGDSAGGCFSGDTKIALVDGRSLSFLELIKEQNQGKQNYCYSMADNGHVTIAPIKNVRRTKQNAQVIKIVLDNDEEIICTPDHKFRLSDGSYSEAQNLTKNTSIAPLQRQISRLGKRITIEGYELVFDPADRRWIFTHLLADQYNLKRNLYPEKWGPHRHHLDFNKLNNNPDNIVRMPKELHFWWHRKWADIFLRSPEVLEKLRKIRQTKTYRQKISNKMLAMRDKLSARAKKQWEDQTYKEFMTRKFLEFYNNNEGFRTITRERLSKEQQKYWADPTHREMQSKRVEEYFNEHPEHRVNHSEFSKKQWQDTQLVEWRREKTKEQWTPEFRIKRKQAYNQTYYQKTIAFAKRTLEQFGSIAPFDKQRIAAHDHSILSLETFTKRFFGNNRKQMEEAVQNYNHKIKKIISLDKRIDVYDLEVPETHNFALAAGVFVHNSSKQGRDRKTQAILPLRGKILNVERARIDKMLQNNEIRSLIIALGTNFGEQFKIEDIRYHKIVIMTDADVDGSHIRTLLLTLFYRYFPELVKQGYIYIAQPPLYRVALGKEVRYVYTEEEKEKATRELLAKKAGKEKLTVTETETEIEASGERKVGIQRYKGLGEMNPEQLWETTMNPANRVLLQVTIDDAEKADDVFDVLMGADVAPRKRFIQTHAKTVKNLDI